MKSLTLAAVLAGLLATPALADQPQTVEDFIKLAQQKEGSFFTDGHYSDLEDAINIYTEIIKQYPKEFPDVYASRADDYASLGMNRKAIADFTKALELDPPPPKGPYLKHDTIYEKRGESESDIEDYGDAVADFTRAIKLRPNDWSLVSDRAEARLGAGDCAGAISDYSSSIEHTTAGELPSSLDYEGRAVGRICTGDLDLALEDYRSAKKSEAALDTETKSHFLHRTELNKWVLLVYMGRKAQADQELSDEMAAATEHDADYDAARYFLGQIDQAAVFSNAEALKKKQPEAAGSFETDALYYVGLKAVADGDKPTARKNFRKILVSHQRTMGVPESARAWLAEINRKRGK